METLSLGKHNPKLIDIRKAVRGDTLTSDGLLVIEGPILLEEAERSGLEIVDVFTVAAVYDRRQSSIARSPAVIDRRYSVTPAIFKTIQTTEHSQGVIATVRPPQFTLKEVLKFSPALIVILGRLQDPGNVGTILRIGESFGATGSIGLRGTASFRNSKVVRASAGSVFRFPHVGGLDLTESSEVLKSKKVAIVGTSPTGSTTIDKWDWRKPTAVLVGNEGSGLSGEEFARCDAVLRIPHSRTVESLNSAIATAVILYEASKQRSK